MLNPLPKNFYPNKLFNTKVDYPLIVLQLDYHNNVSYVRPDIQNKVHKLSERDFILFIHENWVIPDLVNFENDFYQMFKIALFHDGSWEVVLDEAKDYSFEQLQKSNEIKDLKDNSIETQTKNYFSKLYETNKEKRQNRWMSK